VPSKPGDAVVLDRPSLAHWLDCARVISLVGDDGWVGSGFEGCLVAGESSFAVLDRLACLGLLGCAGLCGARCGAGVGEGGEGGGEPVGGGGPGDPLVQGTAHDVFA
jgi:hypothetical protein